MNLVKSISVIIAIFAISLSSLFSQTYTVDTKSSVLKWKGEKIVKNHVGTVQIKSGTIIKNENGFTGDFVIDMTTIKNEDLTDAAMNAKLIGHLKSDDFFSVEKFNNAILKIKKTEKFSPQKKDESVNTLITADLTIKGITNEIVFQARVDFNGNIVSATAKIVINRTKWNVRYGSGSFFDNLGDAAIYDNITFDLTLKGKSK